MPARTLGNRAMAEQDIFRLIPALKTTHESWIKVVLDRFDDFLKDHASCEKKASGMAMSMASHYPDLPVLLTAMVELAVEELNHYREVVRLIIARENQPGPDSKDPYVIELNGLVRKGKEHFLLDRLLIAALIERRGAERFQLISDNVRDATIKKFYGSITNSESRHWKLFINLALEYFEESEVEDRLSALAPEENRIIGSLPIKPALH